MEHSVAGLNEAWPSNVVIFIDFQRNFARFNNTLYLFLSVVENPAKNGEKLSSLTLNGTWARVTI